ncbi:MAG: hypothetical protein ABI655_14380 [Phenylobacterium sp.]
MQLFIIPPGVSTVSVGAVVSLVLWKGDWRGRVIASLELTMYLTENDWIVPWRRPVGYTLALDIVTLAACVACALRGDRYWTLWASSIALLIVATDLVRPLAGGITKWAYLSAQWTWNYLMLAVLLSGVWSIHRARTREVSSHPDRGIATAVDPIDQG